MRKDEEAHDKEYEWNDCDDWNTDEPPIWSDWFVWWLNIYVAQSFWSNLANRRTIIAGTVLWISYNFNSCYSSRGFVLE